MIVIRRNTKRNPTQVRQELDQLFGVLLVSRPQVSIAGPSHWRPALEVFETDRELFIIAEIPGADENSIEIAVDQEILSIRGQRPDERPTERCRYREAGIRYGEFEADVMLPFAVDLNQSVAHIDCGVLKIKLPRAQRTIVPKSSGGSAK